MLALIAAALGCAPNAPADRPLSAPRPAPSPVAAPAAPGAVRVPGVFAARFGREPSVRQSANGAVSWRVQSASGEILSVSCTRLELTESVPEEELVRRQERAIAALAKERTLVSHTVGSRAGAPAYRVELTDESSRFDLLFIVADLTSVMVSYAAPHHVFSKPRADAFHASFELLRPVRCEMPPPP